MTNDSCIERNSFCIHVYTQFVPVTSTWSSKVTGVRKTFLKIWTSPNHMPHREVKNISRMQHLLEMPKCTFANANTAVFKLRTENAHRQVVSTLACSSLLYCFVLWLMAIKQQNAEFLLQKFLLFERNVYKHSDGLLLQWAVDFIITTQQRKAIVVLRARLRQSRPKMWSFTIQKC